MIPYKNHYSYALVARVIMAMLSLSASLPAQEIAIGNIGYQTPYRLVKPAVTQSFRPGSSFELRKAAVLKAAETAYGGRAQTVLGGSEDLLARVDGGDALAKRFAVDNRSVRKGALRAARVAVALERDPRFSVLALDQPVYDSRGKLSTDRDIVFRHRQTGMRGRIEVKDALPSTQSTNINKYKRQIRLMAEEQNKSGQPQAFVNRRPVNTTLRSYAVERGVMVFDNVVTSSKNIGSENTTSVKTVLDELDHASKTRARTRQAGLGFGAAFTILEGSNAAFAWSEYHSGEETLSEPGFRSSLTLAGASFVAKGVSSEILARVNASSKAVSYLRGISRFAGPVGYAFTGAAAGFRGYQFYSGEISTRQFVSETSTTAGGLAGGVAGAWGGAAIGGLGGPLAWLTVPTGAIVGGIGGVWAGSGVVGQGVGSIYRRLDEAQKQELFDQLSVYYQSQVNTHP